MDQVFIHQSRALGNARFVREMAELFGQACIIDDNGDTTMIVHALFKEDSSNKELSNDQICNSCSVDDDGGSDSRGKDAR